MKETRTKCVYVTIINQQTPHCSGSTIKALEKGV